MKKLNFIKCIILALIILVSCSPRKIADRDIDKFIETTKSFDFNRFKNYTIAIRQKGVIETVYFVSSNESNIDNPICFVYVNNYTQNINKIKNFKKNEFEDEIKEMIKDYTKYDYPYLSVDKYGNYGINPFNIDLSPLLYFCKSNNRKTVLIKNFTHFKYYKKNWYLKD